MRKDLAGAARGNPPPHRTAGQSVGDTGVGRLKVFLALAGDLV